MNATLVQKSVALFVLAILFLTACAGPSETPLPTSAPTINGLANPVVIGSVTLRGPTDTTGQTLTGKFTIKNEGTASIIFDELVLGGRLNGVDDCSNTSGVCSDFTKRFDIVLNPGDSYAYEGTFTPTVPGNYDFRVFYRVGSQWHWNLQTKPGVREQVFIAAAKPLLPLLGSRKVIFIDGIDSESVITDCTDQTKVGLVNAADGKNRVRWIVDYLATNEEVKKQVPLDADRDFLYFSYSGNYCSKDGKGSKDYRRPKYEASNTCSGVIDAADKLDQLIKSLAPNTGFDLIGHSMGGMVAAEWVSSASAEMRSRVNSIVTFDSPLRGIPHKKPFGACVALLNVSPDNSSLALSALFPSMRDLWCEDYSQAYDRKKCASVIVSSIAEIGTKVPFFTMDATREDFPLIWAVPWDRTTLLSSKSALHCQFDDDHGSIWDQEQTKGGPARCRMDFSYPIQQPFNIDPPMPGDIDIQSPAQSIKAIFVACAVTRATLDACRNELASPTSSVGQVTTSIPAPSYPVTVNFDLSPEEVIKDIPSGLVNFFGPNTVKGRGIKEIVVELIYLDQYMSYNGALNEVDGRGLRPAAIEEFLAFAAAYPEMRKAEPPIVSLVFRQLPNGSRVIPGLGDDDGGRRGTNFCWTESGWSGLCRVIAVRK